MVDFFNVHLIVNTNMLKYNLVTFLWIFFFQLVNNKMGLILSYLNSKIYYFL